VHDQCSACHLDFRIDFRKQNTDHMAVYFKRVRSTCTALPALIYCIQMRDAWPILADYENNWASAELARQYLSNRRKYLNWLARGGAAKKAARKAAAARIAEDEMEVVQ
jgi:hypothetical protein